MFLIRPQEKGGAKAPFPVMTLAEPYQAAVFFE